MLRHIIVLSFLLLFSATIFGQTRKSKKFAFAFSGIAYNWQETNNIDLGIMPCLLLNQTSHFDNIGLAIAGNVMVYRNSIYLTPITKLRIIKHRKGKAWFGWIASIGHSYTNVQNKYDHRITPEVGLYITFGFSLTAGYNIPVSKYRDNITSPLRFGIRFNTH